jgi:hypothetical protein
VGVLSLDVADSDLEGIDIVPIPRAVVSGRVQIDGRAENDPSLTGIQLSLRREPSILGLPSTYTATPAANGTFSIQSFNSEWRVSLEKLPPNTYVKSIQIGTVDLLSEPLRIQGTPQRPMEIVLGTDSGSIDGRVNYEVQRAAANVTVVLVPEMSLRRRWDLYKVASTDFYGQFHVAGIPPGDYKLFAWEEVENSAWQNSEFLKAEESRGQPIHISASAHATAELNVIKTKQR